MVDCGLNRVEVMTGGTPGLSKNNDRAPRESFAGAPLRRAIRFYQAIEITISFATY
jgi:hypothetical protein